MVATLGKFYAPFDRVLLSAEFYFHRNPRGEIKGWKRYATLFTEFFFLFFFYVFLFFHSGINGSTSGEGLERTRISFRISLRFASLGSSADLIKIIRRKQSARVAGPRVGKKKRDGRRVAIFNTVHERAPYSQYYPRVSSMRDTRVIYYPLGLPRALQFEMKTYFTKCIFGVWPPFLYTFPQIY